MRVTVQKNDVSPAEALAARKKHLAREKEMTRLHDQLLEERRQLPWVEVTQRYVFEGPAGKQTLAELFDGRSELIVYHFMLGPGQIEGCVSCSFMADHIEGPRMHLIHHDVNFVVVSRAPYPEIRAFKERMGWWFPWVSSAGSDFNFDFHVSFTDDEVGRGRGYYNYEETEIPMNELPGASVFAKDESGRVFHTYSAYSRGLDILLGAHNLLDLTPRGRNEGRAMDWVRHHDKYETDGASGGDRRGNAAAVESLAAARDVLG